MAKQLQIESFIATPSACRLAVFDGGDEGVITKEVPFFVLVRGSGVSGARVAGLFVEPEYGLCADDENFLGYAPTETVAEELFNTYRQRIKR